MSPVSDQNDSPSDTAAVVTSWVTVRGRQVRYRIDGDGPPVVLLHGIGRSLEDWAEQHELLADQFRVCSVDLPGFGESDLLTEPYSLLALARSVLDFLDAIDLREPAHLVGNSLGGAVAMRLAVDAPDRVRSLTLVDSAGFGREVTIALRLLAIRPLGEFLLRRPNRTNARRVVRGLFYDPAFVTEERIEHALKLARRPDGALAMLGTGRSLGTFRGVRPEWRAELLELVAAGSVPTLIVWGDRDLILPVAHLAAARRLLPNARTHLFPDTGHMPQIERAKEFHDLVVEFWASTTG
jgi:pimeloyl-ACP methyl ester carboxylesterase